jgi:ATP-dependent helicase HrpA
MFDLEYRFEPGHAADGVTVLVPVGLLDEVDELRLRWLVPGLLPQKIAALLKNLPKALRRQLVPVPETAAAIGAEIEFGKGELHAELVAQLRRRGVTLRLEELDESGLEPHYRFNIRVLGEKQQLLAEGRDLTALRQQLRSSSVQPLGKGVAASLEQANLADWPNLETIPDAVELTVCGMQSLAYPALTPATTGEGVDLRLFPRRREAETAHAEGLNRLFQLQAAPEFRQLRNRIGNQKALMLQFAPYGNRQALESRFAHAVADHVFVAGRPLVYTRPAFRDRLAAGRRELLSEAERLSATVAQVYALLADVRSRLGDFTQPVFAASLRDVQAQLEALDPGRFLELVPFARWQHYPRYLRAVLARLEKLSHNVVKDVAASAELQQRWREYEVRRQQLADKEKDAAVLDDYRWLLEEYRVSLFAQTLKTAVPVSASRLDRLWSELPQ